MLSVLCCLEGIIQGAGVDLHVDPVPVMEPKRTQIHCHSAAQMLHLLQTGKAVVNGCSREVNGFADLAFAGQRVLSNEFQNFLVLAELIFRA